MKAKHVSRYNAKVVYNSILYLLICMYILVWTGGQRSPGFWGAADSALTQFWRKERSMLFPTSHYRKLSFKDRNSFIHSLCVLDPSTYICFTLNHSIRMRKLVNALVPRTTKCHLSAGSLKPIKNTRMFALSLVDKPRDQRHYLFVFIFFIFCLIKACLVGNWYWKWTPKFRQIS